MFTLKRNIHSEEEINFCDLHRATMKKKNFISIKSWDSLESTESFSPPSTVSRLELATLTLCWFICFHSHPGAPLNLTPLVKLKSNYRLMIVKTLQALLVYKSSELFHTTRDKLFKSNANLNTRKRAKSFLTSAGVINWSFRYFRGETFEPENPFLERLLISRTALSETSSAICLDSPLAQFCKHKKSCEEKNVQLCQLEFYTLHMLTCL